VQRDRLRNMLQRPMRLHGIHLKGVFMHTRQPKMVAHVLREFWVTRADTTHASSHEGTS
jgi:ribosomal protein S19